MATAMPDFTSEAHKCIAVKTIETEQVVKRESLSWEQWYNLYHFARLHPETHERIFGAKIEREGKGSPNFYTESELKALSIARLQKIAEGYGLSTDGRKIDLIQNILRAQSAENEDTEVSFVPEEA